MSVPASVRSLFGRDLCAFPVCSLACLTLGLPLQEGELSLPVSPLDRGAAKVDEEREAGQGDGCDCDPVTGLQNAESLVDLLAVLHEPQVITPTGCRLLEKSLGPFDRRLSPRDDAGHTPVSDLGARPLLPELREQLAGSLLDVHGRNVLLGASPVRVSVGLVAPFAQPLEPAGLDFGEWMLPLPLEGPE
jgi:hypothetical protein